jgi:hypothetical protein
MKKFLAGRALSIINFTRKTSRLEARSHHSA